VDGENQVMKVYEYKNCSTCKKALKFLDDKGVKYERLPIVDQPPTVSELKTMLGHLKGDLRALFNTSGQLYREMNVAEKLKAGLSEAEALKLLAANGKLIKRPFVLTQSAGAVGFKPEEWKRLL
jgi:Spx/MgsR family transcriptional regulator